jgi:hypothetical protein
MDIYPNGAIGIAIRASGSPAFMSIEAVYSLSATGNAAAEGA